MALTRNLCDFLLTAKVLAWIAHDSSAETATAQVIAIGSGTAATIGSVESVTTSTQFVQQIFWLPTSSGYTLVTGIGIPSAGQAPDTASTLTYAQWSFASAAAAASAQSTTWITGFPAALGTAPVATAEGAVLFRQNANPEIEQVVQIGDGFDGQNHTATTVPVRNEPVFLAPAANSPLVSFPAPTPPGSASSLSTAPGYQFTAAAVTADSSALFLIAHNYFRCKNDPDFSPGEFGSAIAVGKVNDVTSVIPQVSPKLTALNGQYRSDYGAEAYDFGGGVCDHDRKDLPDNRTSRTDTNLTDVTVNRGGNRAIYRLAYVTRNSLYFDGSCGLLAADPEVWVIDATGDNPEAHKFYNLSNNNRPQPPAIGDDDRGDQPQCTF